MNISIMTVFTTVTNRTKYTQNINVLRTNRSEIKQKRQ